MASKKSKTKKKRGGRPKKGSGPSKSDFIRQHPDISASEVVAKAKESGISLSPILVYKVRGRGGAKGSPKGGARRGPKPKNGGVSASDFVRSMPATMKAKEVIDAAKAKGIKLSANLVYMVRSSAKKRGGGVSAPARGRPGRKPRAAAGAPGGGLSAFKRMALEMGLPAARQALDELERGLQALLR